LGSRKGIRPVKTEEMVNCYAVSIDIIWLYNMLTTFDKFIDSQIHRYSQYWFMAK